MMTTLVTNSMSTAWLVCTPQSSHRDGYCLTTGCSWEMYGVFQRRPFPPVGLGPDGTWLMRSSLHAAARTAKFWGNGAYVGQSTLITFGNGCELRTPWVEVHDTERLVDLDDTPSFP
jgi:hypothetical protein